MTVEDDMVVRAKVRLQKQSPFFSYLVQTLNIAVDATLPFESACVDSKKNVSLHPKFVAKIGEAKTTGVLIHEVMHVALDHFGRTGGRDKRLANIAQDIVINDILAANDFELPEGLITDAKHSITFGKTTVDNVDKKTWEEVYEELLSGACKCPDPFDTMIDPQPGERGAGKEGDEEDENGASEQGARTHEAQKLLAEAMAYSKLQGNTPDGIESRLEELLASKVDWRELLSAYISKQIPYDYSFARPSKRSAALGVYLPSVVRESLELVVALDTSGSIGKEEMQRFASEVLGIATSFHGVKVSLIQADCKIQDDIEINGDYEDVVKNIVVKGGGGTSHVPVFEHIAKEHPDARVVVCFTDGFTDYPDKTPEIDTIWAMTTKKLTAPFGATVFVGEEKGGNE